MVVLVRWSCAVEVVVVPWLGTVLAMLVLWPGVEYAASGLLHDVLEAALSVEGAVGDRRRTWREDVAVVSIKQCMAAACSSVLYAGVIL